MRFLGVATVDAPEGDRVTLLDQVFSGGAFSACRSIPAVCLCVAETLTAEAPHGAGDVRADLHPYVSYGHFGGEVGRVES